MTLAKIIPLAFVMIAGPQILSAIFLATSEKWRQNSAAFVAGAAISVTTLVSVAFLLGIGAKDRGASGNTFNFVIILLLLAAGAHTFLTRKTSKPPAWMGKLEEANPKMSFKLGFLLLGVFPTDILTALAVGGTVAGKDDPWVEVLPFVLMTLLFVALPALFLVVLGERAERMLPKVRDWMNANSWVVSECVIALFVAITVSGLE